MRHESMALLDHISELRSRIIWTVVILVVTMIGGLFVANYIIEYLKSVPPASRISWNAFSLWDGIRVYMQFAVVIAMVVTIPFALYQIWGFVKPGLKEHERKAALRYIPISVILFLTGLSFSYFVVFRMAFYFTSKVNRGLGLTETYGISQYFSFMMNIVLPVALVFELPVIIMFLTHLRILNPIRLRVLRRYAYVLLVIIATMISPPDFISHFSVLIPLLLLYELSVLLSRRIYRKQLAADAAREAQWDD